MRLDVNTASVIKFTDKLEQISKSALPVAVRLTLNSAAFETKRLVPIVASSNFITRNKSFFRSLTIVNKAGGWDINSMQSEVGLNNTKDKVVSGLERQESGGIIKGRGLIAMDTARVSKNHNKKISGANQLRNIKLSNSRRKGTGTGFVMIKKGNKGTIFKTKSNGGKRNLIPLYSFSKGRQVSIKRSPFMEPASLKAQQRIPFLFIKEAEKQIKRHLK